MSKLIVKLGVPKLVVADCPVKPIISAGAKDPTLEVADIPVGITIGFEESSVLPKEIVAESPVKS
jgi:hypothetical protein